ncbi:MAG TPA: aminotransferase class III-fold pyridoxal phosphate-dependent enzyme [Oscillatoriaceae cyanobacterium]
MSLVSTAHPLSLDLADLPEALYSAIGRKAQSLAELTRAGLPVPPARALTTAAYAAALAAPEVATAIAEARRAPSTDTFARVREALTDGSLDEDLRAAILEAYRAIGGRVAVRSSGTAEDLAGASFAGMYESYLHVEGDDAVVDAVRRCWASAWSERVAAYAERMGLELGESGMAVILQRMVDAEVAGVLFTLDPLNGQEARMRVEACLGLGEALVSGRVQPDTLAIARRDGRVLEQTVGKQEFRVVQAPNGTHEQPLGSEGAAPKLDSPQCARLAALGRRVQAHYGCPQDIEFAFAEGALFLLQSRPITALRYAGIAGEWTTADFKDGGVSARVCSPYMWSLYDSIWGVTMPGYLRMIQLLRHEESEPWGRVFYGRPYWNVGAVKRCLHLVPGFNERNFDRDLGIEGTYEGDGVVIPTTPATIARALPVLAALTVEYQARLLTNRVFVKRFEGIAARYETDPASLDRDALAARYRRLLRDDYFLTESTYFYTIYNTSNAKLDFKVELEKLNAELEKPLSYLTLLSGLTDLRHLDPLRDLWALAGCVRDNPALRALVTSTPAEDLKETLLNSEHACFWERLANFLHRYRHHGVAELDITQPRWNEDPTFVLQMLQGYVANADPAGDPVAANARQHATYLAERRRAEKHYKRKGPLGALDAANFFSKLDLLRDYAWWREELRDRSSRMYAVIRRETIAVARRLAREGVLVNWEDVWYLNFPEVIELLERRLDSETARRLIDERREYTLGFRNFTNPNELGARFAVGHRPEPTPGALTGIPCAPGSVVARARVVPTIQDAHLLEPGEVLVTRFTDPGWTPLFSRIAGVVTETGGILSHAAVIAREYGIPAVLAVPDATSRIRSGDWVRVDGDTGAIALLDGPPEDGGKKAAHLSRVREGLEKVIPAAESPHTPFSPRDGAQTSLSPAGERGQDAHSVEMGGVFSSGPTSSGAAANDGDGNEQSATEDDFRLYSRPELGRLLRAMGLDVVYSRASGDWMTYERNGRTYKALDLLGGYGANLFGHHHPALVACLREALDDQAPVQAQASNRARAGALARALAERIGRETGGRYIVTLGNSGAEAVEAAIKHAELERHDACKEAIKRFKRQNRGWLVQSGPDQSDFLREVCRELGLAADTTLEDALIALERANERVYAQSPVYFALEGAFHGKTSGALQVTYPPPYREPFKRIGVRCEFLPAHDAGAWERAIARATARTWHVRLEGDRLVLEEKPFVNVSAILVEPIQGEGGIHPLDAAIAAQIRAFADRLGVPLIVDEIQSGMGRTGDFLASTGCGLVGDYYTFAKSLGGGLVKIGALAVDSRRYRKDFGVVHTSTFAEDDLSSRVALRALALLDEADLPARCRDLGDRWLEQLQALVARHPSVFVEVRGRGLMLGLELAAQDDNPSNVIRMLSVQHYLGYAIAGYLLHEEGFRVAPTMGGGNTLRLEPSAFVAPEELDRFVGALDRLALVLKRANAYRLTRHIVGLARRGDDTPVEDFTTPVRKLRREAPRCEKRVAFVGHFITARDAMLWDPSLALLPPGALERYQLATHRVFGPVVYDQCHVTSALGETVHLSFIGINLTSKAIENALRARESDWVLKQVEDAVAIAKAAGCQVVGLGGYTSIVADNGRKITERGIAVTTGNSLTVGMGLAALERGAADKGLVLEESTLGVLGAAGNIGSVYARMMAERVPRLVLIGREGGVRLARLADAIYAEALDRLDSGEPTGIARALEGTHAARRWQAGDRGTEGLARAIETELGAEAPVRTSTEIADLAACRLILTASNSAKPLIGPGAIAEGPVVICDVSVPVDTDPSVESLRPEALVIRGGLVAVPRDPDFRIGGIPLPVGHAYACMSETLLLGLMGIRASYSLGPVEPEKVRKAMDWAKVNGFMLGDYKRDRSF